MKIELDLTDSELISLRYHLLNASQELQIKVSCAVIKAREEQLAKEPCPCYHSNNDYGDSIYRQSNPRTHSKGCCY